MNRFEAATARAIQQHGVFCTVQLGTNGVYDPSTDSVVNTSTDVTLRAYKKHIVATQWNFPNLVGKELAEFYILASALPQRMKIGDKIVVGTDKYVFQSFKEHSAGTEIILYCIVASKL